MRLLFLATYSSRLRQEVKLTLKILPQFGKALVLLLTVFLLYAVLGLSLFSPYSDDVADAQEGAWSRDLCVCVFVNFTSTASLTPCFSP